MGVEISARDGYSFIWRDSLTFEAHSFGGAVVKFTNVQLAAVGQGVSRSNSQYTPARLPPMTVTRGESLHRIYKYFGGARSAFTGQNPSGIPFAKPVEGRS